MGLSYSEGGFAGKVGMNLEYMCSNSIGIGIRINAFSMNLKEPEGYKVNEDEFYGVRRTDLLGGIRFYF